MGKTVYSSPEVVIEAICDFGAICQSSTQAEPVLFGNDGEAGTIIEDINYGGSF